MYVKSHHVTGVKVNKNNPCLLFGKIDFYHTLKQSLDSLRKRKTIKDKAEM